MDLGILGVWHHDACPCQWITMHPTSLYPPPPLRRRGTTISGGFRLAQVHVSGPLRAVQSLSWAPWPCLGTLMCGPCLWTWSCAPWEASRAAACAMRSEHSQATTSARSPHALRPWLYRRTSMNTWMHRSRRGTQLAKNAHTACRAFSCTSPPRVPTMWCRVLSLPRDCEDHGLVGPGETKRESLEREPGNWPRVLPSLRPRWHTWLCSHWQVILCTQRCWPVLGAQASLRTLRQR